MEKKTDREGRSMHTIEIDIEIEELQSREAPAIYTPINPG
jgi:hypothetical protein